MHLQTLVEQAWVYHGYRVLSASQLCLRDYTAFALAAVMQTEIPIDKGATLREVSACPSHWLGTRIRTTCLAAGLWPSDLSNCVSW